MSAYGKDILRGGPGEVNSSALPSNSPPNPLYRAKEESFTQEPEKETSDCLPQKRLNRGQTLVLFHGWGATGGVWERQTEYFQDIVTVRAPTIPAWEAEWFTEYLRGLPLRECLLVGWSLGGMLLLAALSELRPARPAGLVLAGVAPVFTRQPDYPWGQPPALVRAMRRGLKANQRQVLADFADQCLAPEETAFTARAREAFAHPAAAATLAAGLDYLLKADLRPVLPGLPPGAAIIQGQSDRIVDPAQAQFLREQLPGARLHLLPGAGHLPFLTQPAAFNRILAEGLAGEG